VRQASPCASQCLECCALPWLLSFSLQISVEAV
jgi:hypothetical protein